MKLQEFIARFEALGDQAFLANFDHPFLLEAGRVLGQGPRDEEREVFLLRSRGGRPLVLGRGRRCEVRIDRELVSMEHAVFLPPAGACASWTLVDAGSTNGTWVDDDELEAGEPVVLVGRATLSFGPDALFTFLPAPSFLDVFRVLADEQLRPEPGADFLMQATEAGLQAVRLDDVVVRDEDRDPGAEGSQEPLTLRCAPFDPIPLAPGQTVVIGRSPEAELVLPSAQVSRRHAEVERRPDGVYVRDLGSANGTTLDGRSVGAQPTRMVPGSHLEVGALRVELLDDEDVERPETCQTARPSRRVHRGCVRDAALEPLLREIVVGQHSGALELAGGPLEGTLTFRAGEPHDATSSDGDRGAAAARRLIQVEEGEYTLHLDPARAVGERAIGVGFRELRAEAR